MYDFNITDVTFIVKNFPRILYVKGSLSLRGHYLKCLQGQARTGRQARKAGPLKLFHCNQILLYHNVARNLQVFWRHWQLKHVHEITTFLSRQWIPSCQNSADQSMTTRQIQPVDSKMVKVNSHLRSAQFPACNGASLLFLNKAVNGSTQ